MPNKPRVERLDKVLEISTSTSPYFRVTRAALEAVRLLVRVSVFFVLFSSTGTFTASRDNLRRDTPSLIN